MSSGPLSTLPFFVAASTISMVALLPAILAQRGFLAGPADPYLALAPIAVFSPTLAAMLISRFEPGGRGIRAVFRPLRDWRVGPVWYAIAFAIVPLAFILGVAVYKLAGGSGDVHWLYPPRGAQQLVALFMLPLGEEIGWRGFALPRMQARYGPLPASLLLGLGWGLWHIPMFLVVGMHFGGLLLVMVLFFIPGSVIYSWVFNRARGLLSIALVTHAGSHMNHSLDGVEENPAPLLIQAGAMLVLAIVLVVADRKAWRASGP